MAADAPWGEAELLGRDGGGMAESPGCCPWECPLQGPSQRCCCPHPKVTGEGGCGHFSMDGVPTMLCPSVEMSSHVLKGSTGVMVKSREECW